MKQLLQFFSCLEKKCRLSLHVDPNLPVTDGLKFPNDTSESLGCHWDAEEGPPRKFPRPGGDLVVTTAFVGLL